MFGGLRAEAEVVRLRGEMSSLFVSPAAVTHSRVGWSRLQLFFDRTYVRSFRSRVHIRRRLHTYSLPPFTPIPLKYSEYGSARHQ